MILHPAAATGIPFVGLFISSSAFGAADASGGGCDRGSIICVVAGDALVTAAGGGVGLGSAGGRTCGRHRCSSFVVGALVSSSVVMSVWHWDEKVLEAVG